MSANCPVLIPALTALGLLKDTTKSPIIVGGFASQNALDPHSTLATVNWDLAFDEFNSRTLPGLPSYQSGGPSRPFVGLVCQEQNNSDIPGTMAHLTQDVGVTSVLSTLTPTDLYAAWNTTATNQNVFFIDTGSANLRLANLATGGLLWHLLGDPHVLAAPVVSLLHQIEPYIYQQRKARFAANGGEDPDSVPLRVTMVYSSDPKMLDMHDVLTATDNVHPRSQITFNNKSCVDNGTNYREVQIDSANVVSVPNTAAGIQDLETHPPHVVLAMATNEFPADVVPPIENFWGTTTATAGMIRPYYIMSHLIYNSSTLTTMAASNANRNPPLNLRVSGVNYAQAQDSRSKALYGAYLTRLLAANQGSSLTLAGTENFYDGAYYLLYSIAAAARNAASAVPAAIEIKFGFLHVIDKTSGVWVDIGPSSIGGTIDSLLGPLAYSMALWGAMGPPNFDTSLGTGANASQTSAWCIQQDISGNWAYQSDGLIYDTPSQTYLPPSNGVPTCLQNYCQTSADGGILACSQMH